MPASVVAAAACFIVGDCIATRPYGLGGQFPQCGVSAKVGASSAAIIPRVPKVPLRWLVISAGTNDPENPRLVDNLRSMRARARADRVVWVLPVPRLAAGAVRTVAGEHGDMVVAFLPGKGSRQASVHPKSYRVLASRIRGSVEAALAARSFVR